MRLYRMHPHYLTSTAYYFSAYYYESEHFEKNKKFVLPPDHDTIAFSGYRVYAGDFFFLNGDVRSAELLYRTDCAGQADYLAACIMKRRCVLALYTGDYAAAEIMMRQVPPDVFGNDVERIVAQTKKGTL